MRLPDSRLAVCSVSAGFQLKCNTKPLDRICRCDIQIPITWFLLVLRRKRPDQKVIYLAGGLLIRSGACRLSRMPMDLFKSFWNRSIRLKYSSIPPVDQVRAIE
jgi:hypothetical protein